MGQLFLEVQKCPQCEYSQYNPLNYAFIRDSPLVLRPVFTPMT